MDKIFKLLCFMPEKGDITKLATAIIFYSVVPAAAAGILSTILVFTFILSPVAILVPFAATAYTNLGLIFAVLSFFGKYTPETTTTTQE